MPVYEYECRECKKVLERVEKMNQPPLKICPLCEGELVKIISKSSFSLKGSGWAKDGYQK